MAEESLIRSTPMEETLERISSMRRDSVQASNNGRLRNMTLNALVYAVKYLRNRHYLSDEQIKKLSSEDLNRIPEMILVERKRKVVLLGWIPLFGWVFAGKYLLFRKRVKFLRSLNKNIFDKADIEQAINWSYPPPDF